MIQVNYLEAEILTKLKMLNGSQKTKVLDYLQTIPKAGHNTRRYRKKAMKQIREALKNQ